MSDYFVAKYCSDLVRGEPRNIGVLLYDEDEEQWFSRFLGENDDGVLDGRKLRSFRSADTYREWHHYWTRSLKAGAPAVDGTGTISPGDRGFSEALSAMGGEHFSLELGRPMVIPEQVGLGERLVSFLFEQLVDDEVAQGVERGETWPSRMGGIVTRYSLDHNPHWKQGYRMTIKHHRAEETIVFPYAHQNGHLRLYKRLAVDALTIESEDVQQTMHDILWCFMKAQKQHGNGLTRIVLADSSPAQREAGLLENAACILHEECDSVIDIGVESQVREEFSALAG